MWLGSVLYLLVGCGLAFWFYLMVVWSSSMGAVFGHPANYTSVSKGFCC